MAAITLLGAGLVGGALGAPLLHGYARRQRGPLWRAVEGVTWPVKAVMDIIGMPSRITEGVAWSAASGKRLDKSIWQNLTGEDRRDFIDVFGKMGMQKGWARSILGTGANIATDPIIYSRFFALTKLGRAAKAIPQIKGAKIITRIGAARVQAARLAAGGARRGAARLNRAADFVQQVWRTGQVPEAALTLRHGADAYAAGHRALLQFMGRPVIRGARAAEAARRVGMAAREAQPFKAMGEMFVRGFGVPKYTPAGAPLRAPFLQAESETYALGRQLGQRMGLQRGVAFAQALRKEPQLVQMFASDLSERAPQFLGDMARRRRLVGYVRHVYGLAQRRLGKVETGALTPIQSLWRASRYAKPLRATYQSRLRLARRYGKQMPELAEQVAGEMAYAPHLIHPRLSGLIRDQLQAAGKRLPAGQARAIRTTTRFELARRLREWTGFELAMKEPEELGRIFALHPEKIRRALGKTGLAYAWEPHVQAAVHGAQVGAGISRLQLIRGMSKQFGQRIRDTRGINLRRLLYRQSLAGREVGLYKPTSDIAEGLFEELSEETIKGVKRAVMLPRGIADQLNRTIQFQNAQQSGSYFLRLFDRAIGYWKATTLSPWPHYHARNFVQDHYLSFLGGGLNPKNTPRAMQLLSRWHGYKKALVKFRSPGGETKAGYEALVSARKALEGWTTPSIHGRVTGLQVLRGARRGGGLEGFVRAELQPLGARERQVLSQANPFSRQFWPLRKGAEWGGTINDTNRLSHLITRLGKGDTLPQAVASVKRWLYDYRGGLSLFERRVMRRVMPFYSWARLNTENMLRLMLSRPGHFATFDHLRRGLTAAVPGEAVPKKYLPRWLAQRMGVQISSRKGVAGFFILDNWLPLTDVMRLRSPSQTVEKLTEDLNPAVKMAVEQVMNKSIWLKKPIERFPGEKVRLMGLEMPARWGNVFRNLRLVSEVQRWTRYYQGKMGTVPFFGALGAPTYYRLDVGRARTGYYFRLMGEKRELTRAHRMAVTQGREGYANQLAQRIADVDRQLAAEPKPPSRARPARPLFQTPRLQELKMPKTRRIAPPSEETKPPRRAQSPFAYGVP